MTQLEQDLREIKTGMIKHFEDDKKSFSSLEKKQSEIAEEVSKQVAESINKYTLELSEHMLQTIRGVVDNALTTKLSNLERILKEQNEASAPSIKFFKDLESTGSVVQYIAKFIALMGVAFGVIWGAINYIKH